MLVPRSRFGGQGGTMRIIRLLRRDDGAATAEYAITIMAAVGFAGVLVVILRSGEVQGILTDLVHRALTVAG
jgi:Flp pilus assembly pilin Flp